jgi:transposase
MLKLVTSDSERKALEQTLRQIKRDRARRRLKAIGLVMSGRSVAYAARRTGASRASIRSWIAVAKRDGWQALISESYNNPAWRPGCKRKPYVLDVGADVIRNAVRQETRSWARRRLLAISLILEGQSVSDAARQTGRGVRTVRRWIAAVKRHGWQTLIIRNRARPHREHQSPKINIDRDALDAVLRREPRARVRRRLEAVSLVAAGHSTSEAARRAGSGEDSVRRWVGVAKESGWQALTVGRRCNRARGAIDIDRDALEQALLGERDLWIRRRLKAMSLVACGHTASETAHATGCSAKSIRAWISVVRQRGWRALTTRCHRDPLRQKPGRMVSPMTPDEATRLRAEIRVQLAQKQSVIDRSRLAAAERILAGDSVEAVAQYTGISVLRLRRWMRRLRRGGVAALRVTPAPKAPLLQADAAALRALAAKPEHRQIAKVLVALAHLAEGSSSFDAATRAGIAQVTLQKSLAIFREKGIGGLHAAAAANHAFSLTQEQKRELVEIIKANPAISLTKLASVIRRRFGIAYTERDLLQLAVQQLGYQIRWKRGRRHGPSTPSSPGTLNS